MELCGASRGHLLGALIASLRLEGVERVVLVDPRWPRAGAGDDDGARATLLWNGTFHSCSAGVTRLDSKPYIQVTGPEQPGWEMVTFAAGEEYSLADASQQPALFEP